MSVRRVEVAPGVPGLALESAELSVIVLPDKGCDVYALIDRETGVDLLFKSPWGLRRPGAGSRADDSAAHWLEHYPGGWQLVLPNGGAPSAEHGTEWGFHGEACLVPWTVDDVGAHDVRLSTRLFRAPLTVERRMAVEGLTLRIEEAVTNESPDPIELMWGHHPAFGAPFVQGGCVLRTGARTLRVDESAPGSLLPAGERFDWPEATTQAGDRVDMGAIPDRDERRSLLAYLTDFADGSFAIANPRLGIGIEVRWPLATFPHAWLWQEVHASPGFPWYRRAYVVAVEPFSTIPAHGLATARERGGSILTLAGGERRQVVVEASVTREAMIDG